MQTDSSGSRQTEVQVKLFGAMRDLAGKADLCLVFSGAVTVDGLLSTLERLQPQLMQRLKPGIYQGYISVLVDGRVLRARADLGSPLADGSVVSFVPPFAGG